MVEDISNLGLVDGIRWVSEGEVELCWEYLALYCCSSSCCCCDVRWRGGTDEEWNLLALYDFVIWSFVLKIVRIILELIRRKRWIAESR